VLLPVLLIGPIYHPHVYRGLKHWVLPARLDDKPFALGPSEWAQEGRIRRLELHEVGQIPGRYLSRRVELPPGSLSAPCATGTFSEACGRTCDVR
jgi:hypothetical protein